MTKIQAMNAMEKVGLSFTANVIMNGCGKPATKMRTILKLIESGHDVRRAPFDTCALIVDGELISFGALDCGVDAVLNVIKVQKGA
jgi:hypothetical protein